MLKNILPKWSITSSFLVKRIDANEKKIVRNKATPMYSKIIFEGTSSTFKILPKKNKGNFTK